MFAIVMKNLWAKSMRHESARGTRHPTNVGMFQITQWAHKLYFHPIYYRDVPFNLYRSKKL